MGYRPGLGWVVAAAFLGPGTVTTALVAGASFGSALLWAVPLSVAVTVVLQEAAGRLTAASGKTLGEALRELVPGGRAGTGAAVLLVLGAVVAGAAAFQVGNLLGAALALETLLGVPPWWTAIAVADVAFLLLWFGKARLVERVLGGLVAVMAFAFLINLALLPVDWGAAAAGLVPSLPGPPARPAGADLAVLALVGTTVVPYNLFLHGSLVRARGWGADDLREMRADLGLSVAVGGALTAALVVTAATVLVAPPESAADMAAALGPLLGSAAAGLFAVGLFAAALTSSVTAPLAAAYAATHVLGWDDAVEAPRFRLVWGLVLGVGAVLAAAGLEPVTAIVAAQAANGLLLPVVAVAVVLAVGRPNLIGADLANTRWQDLAGWAAVAVAAVLGLRLLLGPLL